ncbi:peptidoglycan DD-metalloendopeptidase family protein [Brucella sp. 458]|uniref:cell division endopeptidase DipM n=1 Tax=Brucella sp. 458 TaxID=2821140 RepID=UPI001ADF267A|nr:cell division endopeptidase DipM [Brucella sp. 458]QTN98922.1 peptidoglycan DD-metalloendopeptidase family protein [Brucella sp. 458]
MDELNMRLPILQHTSERLLRNVAIVLIAGFGAGCSADTMRFTDGIFTGSTSSQSVAQQPAGNIYASAPVASAPPVSSGAVQRNSLPPVSSAPLGAPVAAASTQMRNQVDQAQDMAASRVNNTVNAAETRVASAATVTHNTVNGAKEKVLGQLPATGQGAPRPMDNNIAGVPQAPAVNGKKSSPTDMASAGGAVATPPSAGGAYVVKSGDSLFSIAKKHNVPVDQLKAANGLTSGAIRVGQSLVIPSAAAGAPTQVAAITPQPANPAKAASAPANGGAEVKPYTPPQASNKVIEDAEKDQAAAPSSTGISQMRWPVRGRILASFGQREGTSVSDGIDIMVPEGTPVKAAENGVVIYAGDGLKEFGQTVLIRHDNGLVTVYGHNSQIMVQRGQKVRRGEEIAKSGMSGNAKSPKLHFEVRKNSAPVNPTKYLES